MLFVSAGQQQQQQQLEGMIEAVVPSATTAKIVAEHGGMLSAMRATPLLSWLIDRARVRVFARQFDFRVLTCGLIDRSIDCLAG